MGATISRQWTYGLSATLRSAMKDFLQFLRKKYSEYTNNVVRQGTIMDELAIKPTGMLQQDFYNSLSAQQTISDISKWSSYTEPQMDQFGNKFFFPRIQGGYAFGSVRIWVDVAAQVDISSTFSAVAADGLTFSAIDTRTISANTIASNVATDNFGAYYFDVAVQADYHGDQYNEAAGQIQALTGITFQYTHVTNPNAMIGGIAHEVNSQYQQRLQYSINDRSMQNIRSVYAGLKNQFPFIYSIFVAGAGNKYMQRDLVQAVDISEPPKQLGFLGKISGNNTVKNSAYYTVYPPPAGSQGASFNGPFSITSLYNHPMTIEAVDLTNTDPAYHGYPLYQEATNDMYQGLYYDDFSMFMTTQTTDLLNVNDEVTTFGTMLAPNTSWLIGTNGAMNGDYGIPAGSGIDAISIASFNGDTISLSGGTQRPITVCKDIFKRTGVKITGSFVLPSFTTTTANSTLQFMVGGPTTTNANFNNTIDSFSGLGFGIYVLQDSSTAPIDSSGNPGANATVFFTNSQRFTASYTFDLSGSSSTYGNVSSLLELPKRFIAGRSYDFEYVFYDDLTMSLMMQPTTVGLSTDNDIWIDGPMILSGSALAPFKNQIQDASNAYYGTLAKVTLDSLSASTSDTWTISNMRIFDINPQRATQLFMFNVDSLEQPVTVTYRGTGNGSVGGITRAGHNAYIWNIETPGPISGSTELSNGTWQPLLNISDPNGTADIVTASLSQELGALDQYTVSSQYGDVIIIMVESVGVSRPALLANGDTSGDVQASLTTDYITMQDVPFDTYHGNHKADVYVDTILNSDNFTSVTVELTKSSSDAYFVLNSSNMTMPLVAITSITAGGVALSSSDYMLVRQNPLLANSALDSYTLTTSGYDDIIITYTIYNNVSAIQNFFNSTEYGKIFGDVLIKHMNPMYLDFGIFYSGSTQPSDMVAAIQNYFDNNVTNIFVVGDMATYLTANGFSNYIQKPITVTYQGTDDNGAPITGTFTDQLTITPINFFRLRTLTASLLS